MTIQEMHYDFKIKSDKIDSLDKDNLLPNEIDWIINEGILLYTKRKYGINNIYKKGFEVVQKRIDDLKTLQVKCPTKTQPALTATSVSTSSIGETFEVKLKDLAFDYLFLTRPSVLLSKEGCKDKVIPLTEISHDDLSSALITDAFSKPSFEWGTVYCNFGRTDTTANDKGSVYIYTDGTFSPKEVYLEYIKAPNKVWIGTYDTLDGKLKKVINTSVSCDLSEETHYEIIDLAIAEFSRIIEDANYIQMKNQKLSVNE